MNHLIFLGKAYIPNLRPLEPFFHVEKFVVSELGGMVDGGWMVGGLRVLKVDFSVQL